MCWIIPLIVGILSAILGYLMGKKSITGSPTFINMREETENLKRQLDNCEIQKAQLVKEHEAKAENQTSEATVGFSHQADTEQAAVPMIDIEENEQYQELLEKYNQVQKELAQQVAQNSQNDNVVDENQVINHAAYQSLLSRYELLEKETEDQLAKQQYETEKAIALAETDVKSNPSYRALLGKYQQSKANYRQLQKQLEEGGLDQTGENTLISNLQIEKRQISQALEECRSNLTIARKQSDQIAHKNDSLSGDLAELRTENQRLVALLQNNDVDVSSSPIAAFTAMEAGNTVAPPEAVPSPKKETKKADKNADKNNKKTAAKKKQGSPAAVFDSALAKSVLGKKIKENDLTLVEGIGPKIAELFHAAEVTTWKGLADTSIEQCQEILHNGGKRFVMHNPGTWPQQAGLATDGQWQQLLELQQSLKGGRKA